MRYKQFRACLLNAGFIGILLPLTVLGQTTLYSNGAILTLSTNVSVQVNGNAQIQTGSQLINSGTLNITGNLTNNLVMGTASAGKLTFNGTTAQTLSGSGVFDSFNVDVNNPAGLTLSSPLKVNGTLTFQNGILNSPQTTSPLTISANGSVSGVSDARHVNGYLIKQGTGAFTFPVGDGLRYQPVSTTLSSNSLGMMARYFASDAGSASFVTTGASANALVSYNNQEYWDLSPVGTATGTATLTRDAYRNPSITSSTDINVLKVAHKTISGWQNEGGTATGTISAGSITSATISAWSPFTLGAVSQGSLPVTLTSFDAIKQESSILLSWNTVSEVNSERFDVQRSADGKKWISIGSLAAVNNSTTLKSYEFIDLYPLPGHNLYRLKMIDFDGSFAYSHIQSIAFAELTSMTAYPNPAVTQTTVRLNKNYIGSQVNLVSASGRVIRRIRIADETFSVDLSVYVSGLYLLRTSDGKTIKLIKQ